jgi:hypothetical protein
MIATVERRMIVLWNQLTPLEWGNRRAGHLAGFTVLLKGSVVSSESGRGER